MTVAPSLVSSLVDTAPTGNIIGAPLGFGPSERLKSSGELRSRGKIQLPGVQDGGLVGNTSVVKLPVCSMEGRLLGVADEKNDAVFVGATDGGLESTTFVMSAVCAPVGWIVGARVGVMK